MMNENQDEKVPPLIPVLAVKAVEEAVVFYKQLGFREVSSISDQQGQLVHAHLQFTLTVRQSVFQKNALYIHIEDCRC